MSVYKSNFAYVFPTKTLTHIPTHTNIINAFAQIKSVHLCTNFFWKRRERRTREKARERESREERVGKRVGKRVGNRFCVLRFLLHAIDNPFHLLYTLFGWEKVLKQHTRARNTQMCVCVWMYFNHSRA